MSAGYSKTPLVKKLGMREGMRAVIISAPDNYFDLLGPLPDDLQLVQRAAGQFDFIHLFVRRRNDLMKRFGSLKNKLQPTGLLWVSWPKKTSQIASDLDGNQVRQIGLDGGLVDIKVCAVDEDWSGLKFVIRRKDRK